MGAVTGGCGELRFGYSAGRRERVGIEGEEVAEVEGVGGWFLDCYWAGRDVLGCRFLVGSELGLQSGWFGGCGFGWEVAIERRRICHCFRGHSDSARECVIGARQIQSIKELEYDTSSRELCPPKNI